MTASPFTPVRAIPGDLPAGDAGPVFKAPWEAQAFALVLALHQRGAFTWAEWAQALGEVIAELRERGAADTGEDYYQHWLTALERLVTRRGLIGAESLARRREAWAEAARRTPHGQPIELPRE